MKVVSRDVPSDDRDNRHRDVLTTTSSHALGRQVVEVPPLRVSFPLELTFVTRHESRIRLSPEEQSSSVTYAASIGGSKVLRSVTILSYSARETMPIVLSTIGLLDNDADGKVAHVLAPHFPKLEATFVRSSPRTPRLVGAVFETDDSAILFYFQLFRGALKSPVLPAELQRAIRIELIPRPEGESAGLRNEIDRRSAALPP